MKTNTFTQFKICILKDLNTETHLPTLRFFILNALSTETQFRIFDFSSVNTDCLMHIF